MSKKGGISKHIRKTDGSQSNYTLYTNSNLEYKELNKNIGLMPLHRGGNGRRRMKRSMRYM